MIKKIILNVQPYNNLFTNLACRKDEGRLQRLGSYLIYSTTMAKQGLHNFTNINKKSHVPDS
jgi:hypothetical protein